MKRLWRAIAPTLAVLTLLGMRALGAQTIGGGGSGNATAIQGTPVEAVTPSDGTCLVYSAASARWQPSSCSGTASTAWSALTPGTNTAGAFLFGTGASLATSGTGTIIATSVPASGLPALTGDVTSSAGSAATTVVKVNGAALPASELFVGTDSQGQLVPSGATNLATTGNGGVTGTLGVGNGGTGATTLAAAGIAVAIGTPSAGNCVKWASPTTLEDAGAACGSGGGGMTNPMTALADTIYGGAGGTPTRLAGPATPNGTALSLVEIPSGSAASAPIWQAPTVGVNAQTGASYTIQANPASGSSDLGEMITANNASAQTYTLCTLATTGCPAGFFFSLFPTGAGTVTLAPAASQTVTGDTAVPPLWLDQVVADSSTDWISRAVPTAQTPEAGDLGGTFHAPTVTNLSHVTNGSLAVSGINATGTPSSTTYLEGDGKWAAAGGGAAGVVDITTPQTANIGATTIFTPAANGFYIIKAYEVATTAGGSGATLPYVYVQFTDADTGQSESNAIVGSTSGTSLGNYANAYNTFYGGSSFYAKGGDAVQYHTAAYVSGTSPVLAYTLHIRVLGPY